jgi:CheY-like chemotaxis protein
MTRFEAPSRTELAGIRLLIADDDRDVLELLADMLSSWGIELQTATSGDVAFARFIDWHPDVVISDVQMSGGSGLDLIRGIRALAPELGGLTPAIALTGTAPMEELFDAGFHFVLSKPTSTRTLVHTLCSFVRAEELGRDTWSVGVDANSVVVRLTGHVTGSDMRAATSVLVPLLAAARSGYHVIADLRSLTSFTPSVGAVGQLELWGVRAKIRSVRVLGGSHMVQLVSRGACRVMGIPCLLDAAP